MNCFVNFNFDGICNLGIAYKSNVDLKQKIIEAVKNYQWSDNEKYEDMICNIMSKFNVEVWCFINNICNINVNKCND